MKSILIFLSVFCCSISGAWESTGSTNQNYDVDFTGPAYQGQKYLPKGINKTNGSIEGTGGFGFDFEGEVSQLRLLCRSSCQGSSKKAGESVESCMNRICPSLSGIR